MCLRVAFISAKKRGSDIVASLPRYIESDCRSAYSAIWNWARPTIWKSSPELR